MDEKSCYALFMLGFICVGFFARPCESLPFVQQRKSSSSGSAGSGTRFIVSTGLKSRFITKKRVTSAPPTMASIGNFNKRLPEALMSTTSDVQPSAVVATDGSAGQPLQMTAIQMTPPTNVCGPEEETAQVPVKGRDSADIEKGQVFVSMCVKPYATSCVFPGSYVAFVESCSLQCQCVKLETETEYKYSSCRSICTSPPRGLRCFSTPEPGNCCPTYTDCVAVEPSSFKGEWTKDETAYHSCSFRCTAQETLDSASCLMLIKEAMPKQEITTMFRATCTCAGVDTFKIQMFNSVHVIKALENPQKFTLVKASGKIHTEKFQ